MAATDYLEKKWKNGFRFFNINKNGYLSRNDFDKYAGFVAKKAIGENADEQWIKRTEEEMAKWFAILQGDSSSERISEEMWMEKCRELYQDVEHMKKLHEATYTDLVEKINVNKDDRITKEELAVYYEGHGVTDESFVAQVFKKLDATGRGFIEKAELVRAGVSYWTNPNPDSGCHFMYDPSDEN